MNRKLTEHSKKLPGLFDRGGLAAKLKEKRAGGLADLPQALDFPDKFQIALV